MLKPYALVLLPLALVFAACQPPSSSTSAPSDGTSSPKIYTEKATYGTNLYVTDDSSKAMARTTFGHQGAKKGAHWKAVSKSGKSVYVYDPTGANTSLPTTLPADYGNISAVINDSTGVLTPILADNIDLTATLDDGTSLTATTATSPIGLSGKWDGTITIEGMGTMNMSIWFVTGAEEDSSGAMNKGYFRLHGINPSEEDPSTGYETLKWGWSAMDTTLVVAGAYDEYTLNSGTTPPDFTMEFTLENDKLTLTYGTYVITLIRE